MRVDGVKLHGRIMLEQKTILHINELDKSTSVEIFDRSNYNASRTPCIFNDLSHCHLF